MGGLGSAALGILADHQGLDYVFKVCAFLPLLGFLAFFLPKPNREKSA
jgi:FSR family fosmidomycin resistance protein-like MFS transporter